MQEHKVQHRDQEQQPAPAGDADARSSGRIYANPLSSFLAFITDDTELSDRPRRLLALVCMLIAVIISFQEYTAVITKNTFLGSILPDSLIEVLKVQKTSSMTITKSIAPTFQSMLFAGCFVLSFIIRNRVRQSTYTCFIYLLNILFCASFISIFIDPTPWNVPFINIASYQFFLIGLVASWFCMRSLAGAIWLILFIAAMSHLCELNQAFGIAGVVYCVCGFGGIWFQLGDADTDFLTSLKSDFCGDGARVQREIAATSGAAAGPAQAAANDR